MREINDFDGSLLLVEIGCKAAKNIDHPQRTSELLTAHLLNTKGVVSWLTYDYTTSKLALEESVRIRRQFLESDDIELIGTTANLASLTAAEGRYGEAKSLYESCERDHDSSKQTHQAKRLASCRYAATLGRLETEVGNFEEAERHLIRSEKILAVGEDNALYRRAIQYCFGNLRLAERRLTEAETHYRTCLDSFDEAIVNKDQLRSCGCYYKLAVIKMLEAQPLIAR